MRPSTVPVGPAAVHSSRRASLPPSTGEGMAPSAFDPGEVDTGLASTSDPPTPTLNGASAVVANGIDCAALPTGAAFRVGAGSATRAKMDSSSSSSSSSPALFWRVRRTVDPAPTRKAAPVGRAAQSVLYHTRKNVFIIIFQKKRKEKKGKKENKGERRTKEKGEQRRRKEEKGEERSAR